MKARLQSFARGTKALGNSGELRPGSKLVAINGTPFE